MQIFDSSLSASLMQVDATATKAPRPRKKKEEPAAPPLPTDQVEMGKTPHFPVSTGNKITPLLGGDVATDGVVEALSSAKSSIQVEIYRLGYDKIVDVLARQAQSGVDVHLLLDPTPGYDAKDAESQAAMRRFLEGAGVKIHMYPIDQSGKIDHVKLLIVDGKQAVIGGLNWDRHSHENLDTNALVEGPAVADLANVFAHDWKISGGGETPAAKPTRPTDGDAQITVATTEEDSEGIRKLLMNRIDSAKSSVRMLAFALADKEVIDSLIGAKNRGVDVKVILDPNKPICYTNEKSKKLLEAAGIEVRYLKVDLDSQEKLHAKTIAFDDDTVIMGSANFTKKGLTVNHEADCEVISKTLGKAMSNFYEDLWANRTLPKLPDLPDFEERATTESPGEQTCHELFGWYNDTFHPDEKHNWVGKRKTAILEAFAQYKESGGRPAADAPEAEQIGALAAFLDGKNLWDVKPGPGSYEKVWQSRVAIAAEAEAKVPGDVGRYRQDMIDAVQDPQLKGLLVDMFDKAPEGFFKAPSSSTGKYHPADETRAVDVKPRFEPPTEAERATYPGGGLVLHSRRNVEMSKALCEYYGITGRARDEVLMAQALHDIVKFASSEAVQNWKPGDPLEWGQYTTKDHAHAGAEFVKKLDPSGGEVTKTVQGLIDMHMGMWNFPNPTPPKNDAEMVMQLGDVLSSQRNVYVRV